MRAIILLCSALALSNCVGLAAVPPTVSYLGTAATVFSYLATGKGTSDHVIPAIAEKDCALHRALLEDGICSRQNPPKPATDVELAAYLEE